MGGTMWQVGCGHIQGGGRLLALPPAPQPPSKQEPDPTGQNWLKVPRKAGVTPINPCKARQPPLPSPNPPSGQAGWHPAGCLSPLSPSLSPPGMTAALSPAQRPRQRMRGAKSCMVRSGSPAPLAASATLADVGRDFGPGSALVGCVEGFSGFVTLGVAPGSQRKGHGAGLQAPPYCCWRTDRRTWGVGAGAEAMGSAWRASLPAPAAVPGGEMPWDATGSAEHQTWGNRGIGSTWGHPCIQQPCSLPSTCLSSKSSGPG